MPTVPIPGWAANCVLPPFSATDPLAPAGRAPYQVSLVELIQRFIDSYERCQILRGLLSYRAALHSMGICAGFQWLDGSFMEDIETSEGRTPRDLDVVTFLHEPDEPPEPTGDARDALDPAACKRRFKVDAYLVQLDVLSGPALVKQAAYWYSVWSHRRDCTWKGFLEVSLDPVEDADALSWLDLLEPPAPQPADGQQT